MQAYQGENLILILSPPRSGSTLLQRMVASHSAVQTHPEPHILTPLAFQGYFYRVDKADYNHKVAGQALREFVEGLPRGEEDFLDACREYCRVLYTRALPSGKQFFLDKTPNYADAILPFVPRLLPKARYIVLTRHPLAILSSRAQTFYGGNYDLAHYTRDLLADFVPPLARFLRQPPVPMLHVKYESLVGDPEQEMRRILGFLDLPYEEQCLDFGTQMHVDKSYGDPKIGQHNRPVRDSIDAWARDFIADPDRRRLCERNLAALSDADLRDFGYPRESLWQPLEDARKRGVAANGRGHSPLQRAKWRVIWLFKAWAKKPPFSSAFRKLAHFCEAALR